MSTKPGAIQPMLLEYLKQNQDVASAVAALTSAAAAVIALLISLIAVLVAWRTASQQRKHNKLSVRPIPEITVADYEDSLRVKLRNHGAGPLLINSFSAVFQGSSCKSLIDCMPDLNGRHWTNFSGTIDGRTLLPGKEIVLVELTAEPKEVNFSTPRDLARLALSETQIFVSYSDIYESEFPQYTKSLSWFRRNLE